MGLSAQGRQAGLPGVSTPTSPSPAPSRIACSSPAIRTCWSRASRFRPTPSAVRTPTSTFAARLAGEAKIAQAAVDEAYAAGLLGKAHRHRRGLVHARHHGAPGRRRLHLRRGNLAAQFARGQARLAAHEAALPGGARPLRSAHHRQQRRDPDEHPRHRESRRGMVRQARHGQVGWHARAQRVGAREPPGRLRVAHGHSLSPAHRRSTAAACWAGGGSKASSPAAARCPRSTRARSTCRSNSTR